MTPALSTSTTVPPPHKRTIDVPAHMLMPFDTSIARAILDTAVGQTARRTLTNQYLSKVAHMVKTYIKI
jgi:hypothetical protein